MRTDLVELLRCPRSGATLALQALERDGEEVESGLLRSDAGTYPIVAGIPLLRGGDDRVVELLLAGDAATATALAVADRTPLSRLDAVLPLLLELRPSRAAGRRLLRYRDRLVARRAATALAAASSSPEPLLRMTYLGNRRPNPEGYRYFRYRLGLPRHLVALGAVAAALPGPGPVVEVGCGAGHLTGQFQAMLAPRRIVAVERDLDLLWIARRHLAPAADHVCADANALPLADGSCSLAVAIDVLSFVETKATATRELRRVVEPGGGLVLTSLINAAAAHEFSGFPLPVPSWRRLVAGPDHVALSDRTVLDAYLGGSTAPGCSDDDEVLGRARTITVLGGQAAAAGTGAPLGGWPHAAGRLGPHPLLRRVPGGDGTTVLYRKEAPSEGFARDNADLDRYLPAELAVSQGSIDEARAGVSPAALAGDVARVAVLGYPERWPGDPWSA